MTKSAVALVLVLFLAANAPVGSELLRLTDYRILSLSDALPDLKQAKIVFMGESHDSMENHAAQLELLRMLREAGIPVAIGLEMFRKESQQQLDDWVGGKISDDEFRKVYLDNWDLPWRLYKDIFKYARKHKIRMVGLNIPGKITKKVANEGFSSLTPEETGRLPKVECRVDPAYEDFMMQAFGAHHHGGSSFTHFCEAQLVWDTAMAANLLDFMAQNPTSTVVVLTGNGHAWRSGIPDQVRRRSDVDSLVILSQFPDSAKSNSAMATEADYLWLGFSPTR